MLVSGLAAGAMAGAQIGTDLYNTYEQTKIARQNLQFQRENLAYQKDVQNTEWMREDNAVQRRKADLIAAGLSPVLAAGSAANAGPVVATQAPRRDPVTIPDTAAKVMALIRGQQDIAQSNAQIDLIKAQTAKAEAEKVGQDISNAVKNRDFQINKASALPSDASPYLKLCEMVQVLSIKRLKTRKQMLKQFGIIFLEVKRNERKKELS